jgi:hypothetical protein
MPPQNRRALLPLTRLLKPQLIELARELQLPDNGRVVDLRSRVRNHLRENPVLLDDERYAHLLPNHERPPEIAPPDLPRQTPLPPSVPRAQQPGHGVPQGADRGASPWNGINNPPLSSNQSHRGALPLPPIDSPQNLFHHQYRHPPTPEHDSEDRSFVLPPINQPPAHQNSHHDDPRMSVEPNDSKSLFPRLNSMAASPLHYHG